MVRVLRNIPLFPVLALSMLIIAALFGEQLTSHDAVAGDLSLALRPPVWVDGGTWDYPLGTDALGRDMLTRLLASARTTLMVGVSGVALAGLLGSIVGLVSGFYGGWVDVVCMRITDVFLSVPVLVLGLAVATVLGRGTANVIIVLVVVTWTFYARLVRGEVLTLREMDYVWVAQVTGVSSARILWRHILPNTLNTVVVVATLQVGYTIIVAASLSFLGLGVPDTVPEWGLMLAEGQAYLRTAWWLSVMPGIALALTVLAANLFGDWLRDRVDPNILGTVDDVGATG